MSEHIHDRSAKMERIYQKLLEQALKDGIISADEDKILLKAKERIRDYQKFVDQALEDDVVTVREHSILLKLQDRLIRDIEKEIEADNVITEDEKLLIDTIKKMMKDF